MAKFLHLTEMPGLHLPWLDVALPEPDEQIDFLSQNLSQTMTLTHLNDNDAEVDSDATTNKTTGSSTGKNESRDSSLPFFMDSTAEEGNRVREKCSLISLNCLSFSCIT